PPLLLELYLGEVELFLDQSPVLNPYRPFRYLRHGDALLWWLMGPEKVAKEAVRRLRYFLMGNLDLPPSGFRFSFTRRARKGIPFRGYRLRSKVTRDGWILRREVPYGAVVAALVRLKLARRRP